MKYSSSTNRSILSGNLSSLILAVLLVGCGVFKSVEDTNANTEQVNEKVGKVEDNTKELENDTKDLKLQTGKINSEIEQVNKKLEETNKSLQSTNDILAKTQLELQNTNKKFDLLLEQLILTNQKLTSSNEKLSSVIEESTAIKKVLLNVLSSLTSVEEKVAFLNAQIKMLHKSINHLNINARQGISSIIRSSAFKTVFTAKSIDEKLAAAATYYSAFEFQLTDYSIDTSEEDLDFILTEAVSEFYRHIAGVIDRTGFNLRIDSSSNDMQSLYALSATLDTHNPRGTTTKVGTYTLSSIEDILKISLQIDSDSLPNSSASFLQEALKWTDLSSHLLRLRHNFLTAFTLVSISSIDRSDSMWNQIRKLQHVNFPWKINLKGELQKTHFLGELSLRISQANETRLFLERADMGAAVDSNLSNAFRNLTVDSASVNSLRAMHKNHPQITQKFIDNLMELKNGLAIY